LITISINPIAFTIGGASVRWYGIMVALAVAVVVLWTLWAVKREAKLSYETVITAALVGIPSGIIFSKLLHVIDMWDYYTANPGLIWGFAGLAIWGAVLGATLGVWIYSKFRNLQFGYLVDLVAPGIILAQAVGRVGCTINGCCYGVPTSLPWGVIYTHPESYGYAASLALPEGMGLHPTQVYEIIFCLIVFVVLLRLRGHFKPDGSLFLIYLSAYSLWRIGIDFLREGTSFLFGLHQAQVIGIVVLLIAVPIMVMRTRWVKAESKA
jgi:phosphatidylglycerol:prolipoprotein diacylglycerol transferase